jgi:4-amino-4-deoxy-L-arabinose transferase-like glycosyltransferase
MLRISNPAQTRFYTTTHQRAAQRRGVMIPTLLVLFMLALLPRTLGVGSFVTVDEGYHWFGRAERFATALGAGNYAATNQVGHPGVTTMWLGAIGVWLRGALEAAGNTAIADPYWQRTLLRLPVGVVTALCVALAFPMLRRLLGGKVALLAALLWAAEPFVIAHSQLLHTDALLTSFMTLALLAALIAFGYDTSSIEQNPIRWPWLIASAGAGGLALLTKSPSVLLAVMIGLLAVSHGVRRRSWRDVVQPVAVWGGVAALTWFALWPAAWVDLPGALRVMYTQASSDGGSPHGWGNFFWGHAVADPGPLFYPVALALRLAPWTLIGIALLAVVALAARHALPNRRALLWIVLFALLFAIMVTIPPKKFDRYALPIFPALDMLAAAGWIGFFNMLRRWLPMLDSPVVRLGAVVAIALGLAVNVALHHPYEIAFGNPILGGGPTAQRLIPIGWGEGFDQVGAYISAQSSTCDQPVATWFGPMLDPFVCGEVLPLDWALQPDRAGYAVMYVDQLQRNNMPEVIALLRDRQPLHTVAINGIAYASIYQIAPPPQNPIRAEWVGGLRLDGYTLDTATPATSDPALRLALYWHAATAPMDRMMFIHVLDQAGNTVGQADVPLVGPHAPAAAWGDGRVATWSQPVPLQPDLPPGEYELVLGLYGAGDGARLPLRSSDAPGAANDGADTVLLGTINLQ